MTNTGPPITCLDLVVGKTQDLLIIKVTLPQDNVMML